eukprot:5207489-Pleurochrysis_carterae.AAC.1
MMGEGEDRTARNSQMQTRCTRCDEELDKIRGRRQRSGKAVRGAGGRALRLAPQRRHEYARIMHGKRPLTCEHCRHFL